MAVTATDHSPIVGIIALLSMVIAVLAVGVRLVIKYVITKGLSMDDYLILVAVLFCVVQSICIVVAATHGLGKAESSLSEDNLDTVFKAAYAAEILYVASLTFAKLSSLAFVSFLTQRIGMKEWIFGGAILVWAFTAEFAVAFQCQLPRPWTGQCFDRDAWWTYFAVNNMLIEAALIVLPALLVIRLQTAKKKAALICFLLRIVVIAVIILELYYRHRTTHPSALTAWPVSVCMQSVQSLAILAACIPYLKPFMEGLQSTGLHPYLYPKQSQGSYATRSRKNFGSQELRKLAGVTNRTNVSTDPQEWEAQSQSSQSHIIIRETRTWAVDVQSTAGGD
ncbi:hypothetical protein ASPZODRAFT_133712 [Penicilliopsis zonata CBS 506.65]|uniref:Rhodopsin domain-containing protein n=1 Tax=Penicilliopsis zonata CBS 506.65 TaxID=1073090 RepID=A0A1L9SFP5_9EURO|nr:hypothetical protein ASPZODRAFT_133712 [Penicilliopsis zonata CBS 506.65]OJJ45844.1 hypothetical protein ASPZODRAFT_133712 [Penicilliopsis zonata CBS 506.65]